MCVSVCVCLSVCLHDLWLWFQRLGCLLLHHLHGGQQPHCSKFSGASFFGVGVGVDVGPSSNGGDALTCWSRGNGTLLVQLVPVLYGLLLAHVHASQTYHSAANHHHHYDQSPHDPEAVEAIVLALITTFGPYDCCTHTNRNLAQLCRHG